MSSNEFPDQNTTEQISGTLNLPVEQVPPQVSVDAFDDNVTVPLLSGRASDESGISLVQYSIDDGPRLDVDSITGDPTQKTRATANLDFDAGTIRKLAVGLALALGMGAVGLASSGTAAANGMNVSASPPAIMDEDGTQGDWRSAVHRTVSAAPFRQHSSGFVRWKSAARFGLCGANPDSLVQLVLPDQRERECAAINSI
jgi:hypothetical protein